MEEGEPIEHKLVTRAIATAQKRVENHNFEIRKHLLEYDDVMNKQREIIYGMRRQILEGESQADTVVEWIEDLVGDTLDAYASEAAHVEDWDLGGLTEALSRQFDVKIAPAQFEGVVSREGLQRLARAVGRLPPEFRAAFLLRAEEGLSFREIADALGLTEETARWRVYKARRKLVQVLAPELDGETP